MMALADPPSPCVQVCVMDPDTGLCRGCLRTLDEIARWGQMRPEEKRATLERLSRRTSPAKA